MSKYDINIPCNLCGALAGEECRSIGLQGQALCGELTPLGFFHATRRKLTNPNPVMGENKAPEFNDRKVEKVDHPAHYGGGDNPYEAIKVVTAWNLGFCLGNVVKYISRAGKKDEGKLIEDLKKARWYLDWHIKQLEKGE